MSNVFIIGFEGPCLAGKTTTVKSLLRKLNHHGLHVIHLKEYTELAGGHEKMPELIPNNKKESKKSAKFFIDLENRRKGEIDRWKHYGQHTDSIVFLVDRLLTSCLVLRLKVNDYIGYKELRSAISKGRWIKPDITFLLDLPASKSEIAKRRKQRVEFRHSSIIYDPDGYNDFIGKFSKELINLNLINTRSDYVEFMFDTIIKYMTYCY
jgi:thymidylate kinase